MWLIVRAHHSKKCILKVCKAFFSRICHAVVFTQFGYADSKSAPRLAQFCLFSTRNSKTKWPSKFVKMSQRHVHHGLAHNEHKNIISVSKITFWAQGIQL